MARSVKCVWHQMWNGLCTGMNSRENKNSFPKALVCRKDQSSSCDYLPCNYFELGYFRLGKVLSDLVQVN